MGVHAEAAGLGVTSCGSLSALSAIRSRATVRRELGHGLRQVGQEGAGAAVDEPCTASSRRPSTWKSASHCWALSRKYARTPSEPGPSRLTAVAPWRAVAVGEIGAERAEHVALGAEVVVDDVEDHGEPAPVALVDEALQAGRAAVGVLDGEGEHAVVAPVPSAGELGDRHQLDRGDPEIDQVIERDRSPRRRCPAR